MFILTALSSMACLRRCIPAARQPVATCHRAFAFNAPAIITRRQRRWCKTIAGDGDGDGDLLLLDRGYPSRWLVAALNARGVGFCMRVEKAGNARFACVRDIASTGKVRVLMTSLLDPAAFPSHELGDLYHQRWRIEEAFKRLEHRLNLEHVSGLALEH